jgi:thioredoxin-related protein
MANYFQKHVLAVFFLCCILWLVTGQANAQQGTYFSGTLAQLQERALKDNKPYMIMVKTSWCGYCKLMERTTFADPEVAEALNEWFIPYALDAEQGEGKTLAQQYKVSAYPVTLFFYPDGKLLGRVRGYQEAELFADSIGRIYRKFQKNR